MAGYDISGVALPCSPEAERSVIGSLLIDGELVGEITQLLNAEHFYVEVNKGIFRAIFDLFTRAVKVDIVTVIEECVRSGVFENDAAAKTYLVDAAQSVPSVKSVAKYASIVIDKYLLRSVILAAKDIIDTANGGDSAETVIDYAEQKIFNIREGREHKNLIPLRTVAYEQLQVFCDLVAKSWDNGGKPIMSGLETGFHSLDEKIYGLNRSDLIVLAARPGMGKTSFALNIAVNTAKKYPDKAICVFNLEMSKEQLVQRVMSSEAQISADIMRTGKITKGDTAEMNRIYEIVDGLSTLNVYIDDTPGATVTSIKAKLRRVKDLGLVVIDYLQLMNSVNNYHGNRVSEISEITRSLKIMAKELNVPIIILSQLARGTEQRPDKRPLMSDLRDSGSIEQDADIVLFLYRNSYYDKTDPNQNTCECILSKNRHGETGTVYLGWRGEYTTFTNASYTPPAEGR